MKRRGSQKLARIYVFAAALVIACSLTFVLESQRSKERMHSGSYLATFSNPNQSQALGGSWSLRSGEVVNTSEERGAKLIERHEPLSDYQVESDVQMDDPHGDVGLILRSGGEEEGVDSYRGYLAVIKPSQGVIEFGRADFGWQLLARQSFSSHVDVNDWLHFHVVAVKCEFVFVVTFADSSSVSTTIQDPSCIIAGRTGLRSSLTSARWRNLKIQPADETTLRAFQAKIQHDQIFPESNHPDIDLTPASVERYMSEMQREALKHVFPKDIQYVSHLVGPPGRGPDVTIVGSVISTLPLIMVQDYTGSIIVATHGPHPPLKLGDMVEVHATVVYEGLARHLDDAKIRVLWSDMPSPPLAVTASQFADGLYRGRSITVEGTLVSATSRPEGYELVLTDENYVFLAIGPPDFRVVPRDLEPGSRLRLRGAATISEKFTKGIYPFAVITDRVDVVSGPPWWSTRHLLWLSAALIAFIASLLISLHLVQRWRMRSVLHEREQLALEIHDTLAQSFTGIGYQLQAASQERRGESYVQAHIRSALQMVKLSHKEASGAISSLRPQYRDAAAIVASLKENAERLSDGGELKIDDSFSGPNLTLPLAVTDAFFRIGQEAVSNAIGHGRCHTLTIRLAIGRKQSCLTVIDDGSGFDMEAVQDGLGIEGMKSRAATAKVEFKIISKPDEGTTVLVCSRHSATGGLLEAASGMLRGLRGRTI